MVNAPHCATPKCRGVRPVSYILRIVMRHQKSDYSCIKQLKFQNSMRCVWWFKPIKKYIVRLHNRSSKSNLNSIDPPLNDPTPDSLCEELILLLKKLEHQIFRKRNHYNFELVWWLLGIRGDEESISFEGIIAPPLLRFTRPSFWRGVKIPVGLQYEGLFLGVSLGQDHGVVMVRGAQHLSNRITCRQKLWKVYTVYVIAY